MTGDTHTHILLHLFKKKHGKQITLHTFRRVGEQYALGIYHLLYHPMAMQGVECHHSHINTTMTQIMLLSDTNIVVNWESTSTIHGADEYTYTHTQTHG